jgi:hypothetical protein
MVTLLITSLFILGFLAVAIYLWQKSAAPVETGLLPQPPEPRMLFEAEALDAVKTQAELDAKALLEAERNEMLDRAKSGDQTVLRDARATGDNSLYEEALNLLVAVADPPALLSLASFISRNELAVNKSLAERFIELWRSAPDRGATAKMLHLAALSDDANTYKKAVDAVMQNWRANQIPDVSAQELRAIIDGEFWILSSPTRSGGAGFVLKQTLSDARLELEAALER